MASLSDPYAALNRNVLGCRFNVQCVTQQQWTEL